jgi:hypothetical protein
MWPIRDAVFHSRCGNFLGNSPLAGEQVAFEDNFPFADHPGVIAMQTASHHALCMANSKAPFANALA